MNEDLARYQGPVSDLFPRLSEADDGSRYKLSERQLAEFAEKGFVAGIRVLDDAQLDALRAEVLRFEDRDHDGRGNWYSYRTDASYEPGHNLIHGLGAWRVSPAFHDLLWHPGAAVPLAQLVGGPVRLLHDQLFAKPAQVGGSVVWHQDYSYWTFSQPMAHATCWIALDDATIENGCLNYVPGSHRWGLLPITGLTGEGPGIEAALTPEQRDAFKPVPVEVRAGEAVFHHPLTVHGSGPNLSTRRRCGAVINVMRDGSRAAGSLEEIDGVPAWLLGRTEETPFYSPKDKPAGPVLDGPYWPLLTPVRSAATSHR